jgi:hypothetical protein
MGLGFHSLFDSANELALDKSAASPTYDVFQQQSSSEDEIDSLNLRCLATDIYFWL